VQTAASRVQTAASRVLTAAPRVQTDASRQTATGRECWVCENIEKDYWQLDQRHPCLHTLKSVNDNCESNIEDVGFDINRRKSKAEHSATKTVTELLID
jgi:hypothetical protein